MSKQPTKYKPKETEQRSYFLPPGLGDAFRDFCVGTRGSASAGAAGAFVLFMACEEFPGLRDRAIRAAGQMEPQEAVRTVKDRMLETFADAVILQYVQTLPTAERGKLLREAVDRQRGARGK